MLPSKSLTFVAFGINYFMSNILCFFFFFSGSNEAAFVFSFGKPNEGTGRIYLWPFCNKFCFSSYSSSYFFNSLLFLPWDRLKVS